MRVLQEASVESRLARYVKTLTPEQQQDFWSGLPIEAFLLWYGGRFMGGHGYKESASHRFFKMPREQQFPIFLQWARIVRGIAPPEVPKRVYRVTYMGTRKRTTRLKFVDVVTSWAGSSNGVSGYLSLLPASKAKKILRTEDYALVARSPQREEVLFTQDSVMQFARAYSQLAATQKLSKDTKTNIKLLMASLSGWARMEEVTCYLPNAVPVVYMDKAAFLPT